LIIILIAIKIQEKHPKKMGVFPVEYLLILSNICYIQNKIKPETLWQL